MTKAVDIDTKSSEEKNFSLRNFLRRSLGRVREPTCYDAAIVALGHLQEWAKWMAGIQTAALGGLGAVVFKAGGVATTSTATWPSLGQARPWALLAFVFLALALLFSSWVLSALGSISLRIGVYAESPKDVSESLDIYHIQSFTWLGGRFTLGSLMALLHWSWAFGLGFLGVFFFTYFSRC